MVAPDLSSFLFHCTLQGCWVHSDHDCHDSCFPSPMPGSSCAHHQFFTLSPSFHPPISLLVISCWNAVYWSSDPRSFVLSKSSYNLFGYIHLSCWIVYFFCLGQWFLKCGPQIHNVSITITWDVLEMEIRRPHHMPPELQTLGVELSSLHFH